MSHPATRKGRAPRTGARRLVIGRGPSGCLGRILLALLTLGLLGVLGLYVAYQRTDLPNPNALASSQVSTVYFADGSTEIGRISSAANREIVDIKRIPVPVQRAFLTAEDRTFYTNQGISPTGIGRALWVGLTGGETQGGSTITQQYVKNYFLSSDQTYTRKVKELFLAVKLDQQKSKDEILADYLNTIYFGRGAYGIQTASKAYFDKDVSALTPAEGAVLASNVRGPSLYDPSVSAANLKRNTERANWILDGMVQLGWLPAAERATMTIPKVLPKKPVQVTGGTNGYLVAAAKAELAKVAKLTEEDFDRGGLKIVTTIDKDQQEKAVEAVQHYWPEGKERLHIGLAAVRPSDGAVTAMYGGADFLEQQFNDATQRAVPGASTFKVFTLTAAVEKGIDTRSTVSGDMPYYPPGSSSGIDNSEGEGSMGRINLRMATADSVNTAFARLNVAIGPQSTAEVAGRLGITVPENQKAAVTNTLGVTDVTPQQMAGAYAAYANKGTFVAPHVVASARTTSGSVDYTADTNGKQVVEEGVAADVIDAMEQVVKNGTGASAVRGAGLTRPVAGKTGTGEDSTSAWFTGFVPQLAASVSMSQLDEQNSLRPLRLGGRPVFGGGLPAKIWARFMYKVVHDQPVEEFPARAGEGTVRSIPSRPRFDSVDSLPRGTGNDMGSTTRRTSTATPTRTSGRTSTGTPTDDGTTTSTRTAAPTDAGTSTGTADPTTDAPAPTRTAAPTTRSTTRSTSKPTTAPVQTPAAVGVAPTPAAP